MMIDGNMCTYILYYAHIVPYYYVVQCKSKFNTPTTATARNHSTGIQRFSNSGSDENRGRER